MNDRKTSYTRNTYGKNIRKRWKKKQLLRNKRSSRGEQDRKKKQEIIWLKKKSCKMTDFSLLPVIPPEVHRMVSPGRKWVWNLGKKMSELQCNLIDLLWQKRIPVLPEVSLNWFPEHRAAQRNFAEWFPRFSAFSAIPVFPGQ